MFNTYYQTGPRETFVSSRTEVTERRAPTDQSVALLSEMERAAETRLIGRFQSQGNEFKFGAWVFDQGAIFDKRIRIRYFVNGNLIDFTITVPQLYAQKEMLLAIRDAIAKELANTLCIENAEFLTR